MSEENPRALNPDLMPINLGPTIGAELAINIGAASMYKIETLETLKRGIGSCGVAK